MKITNDDDILSNSIFRQAIELLDTSVCITDKDARIVYANKHFERQTGYTFEEVANRNPGMLRSVDLQKHLKHELLESERDESSWVGEINIRRKDGTPIWVLSTINPVKNEEGEVVYFVMIEHDITEKKKSLEKSRQRESLLNDIAYLSKTGGFQYDVENTTFYWTKELYTMHGVKPDDNIDHLDLMLSCTHPDHRKLVEKSLNEVIEQGTAFDIRIHFKDRKDQLKWLRIHARGVRGDDDRIRKVIGVALDITSEVNNKKSLEQAYEERGLLLSEIHHRVKNNLGLISGLLQLQKMSSSNGDGTSDLDKSIQRVNSVAILYEQLYRSDNFTDIFISENIRKQLKIASQAFDPGGLIQKDIKVEEVRLNINQAQPLGLLVNEIITNAYKHAFTNQRTGVVTVRLHQKMDRVILYISDDGKGTDKLTMDEEKRSLGYQLIHNLLIQLEADYTIDSKDGVSFHIEFQKDGKKGAAVYTSEFGHQQSTGISE